MLPEDKRWAVGIAVAIAAFFIMVILAGRAYLTDLDEAYFLTYSDEDVETQMTLWMLRNDSKNIPIQVNPSSTEGTSYAQGRIYLQREYISASSDVTLQLRTTRPIQVRLGEAKSLKLEVEVWHTKIAGHRPVIVVEPNQTSTKTTEIYREDLEPSKIASDLMDLGAFSPRFKEDVFDFSGTDDYWEIRVYDSIEDEFETFDGMALFRLRVRILVGFGDGSETSTDWMETEYFAVDLVDLPEG